MTREPPNYDERSIRRLRPPEVEGSAGDWTARWLLRLNAATDDASLAAKSAQLTSEEWPCEVEVLRLAGSDIRLQLRTAVHPLDPESYQLTDRVLKDIDGTLGGILEINGSPRDWWRTFRRTLDA